MRAIISSLIRRWYLAGDGKVMDVKLLSNQFTANVVGNIAFGIDVDSFKNPDDEFCKNGEEIFNSNNRRKWEIFAIFFLPKIVSMSGVTLFGKKATAFIRKTFWYSVNERMRSNREKRYDFIDTMVELKKTYGDQDFGEFSK